MSLSADLRNRTAHNAAARFAAGCLLFLFPSSATAQTLDPLKTAAHRASRAATALRQIAVEDMDTNVPREAQKLIPQLRVALRDLALAVLEGHDNNTDPVVYTTAIQKALSGSNLIRIDPNRTSPEPDENAKQKNIYGNLTSAVFEKVEGHPDLLVFRTNLTIQCGFDGALYVFQFENGKWIEVLDRHAGEYKEISGAYEGLQYAVSPAAPDGSWFIVVAHWNSWCSSSWQGLTYEVLRLSRNPEAPITQTWNQGIYLGQDETLKLATEPHGFTVTYWGGFGDGDILLRPHIDHYQFENGQFRREPPIANDALDFVSEWIALPWSEAQRWTAFAATDARSWHHKLNPAENRQAPPWSVRFFQPCPLGKKWQVGLDLDRDGTAPTQLFFVVESTPDFLLTSISPSALPSCPGEAPPPARPAKLP